MLSCLFPLDPACIPSLSEPGGPSRSENVRGVSLCGRTQPSAWHGEFACRPGLNE